MGVNLLSQQSLILSMVLFHVAAVILSPDPTSVPTPLLTDWPKNAQRTCTSSCNLLDPPSAGDWL